MHQERGLSQGPLGGLPNEGARTEVHRVLPGRTVRKTTENCGISQIRGCVIIPPAYCSGVYSTPAPARASPTAAAGFSHFGLHQPPQPCSRALDSARSIQHKHKHAGDAVQSGGLHDGAAQQQQLRCQQGCQQQQRVQASGGRSSSSGRGPAGGGAAAPPAAAAAALPAAGVPGRRAELQGCGRGH